MSLPTSSPILELAARDSFSTWMGVKIMELSPNYSRISMEIREDMMNGFGTLHGGITFAFADTAFGYASNWEGKINVALDASITFTHPAKVGDLLIAEARCLNNTRKTGLYRVDISNSEEQLVAAFQATCYKTEKPHPGKQ